MDYKEILTNEEQRTALFKALEENKYSVRSTEQEEQYRKNLIEQELPNRIGEKIKEVHSLYENDVKAIFGVDKDPNEKGYEYLKRTGAKTVEELKALRQQKEDLEKALKEADKTGVYESKLSELEKQYKASLEEKESLIAKMQKEGEQLTKKQLLAQEYAPIKGKFRKDLPSYFNDYEQNKLDSIVNSAVVVEIDGKQILVAGENGEPKKDKNLNLIPVSKVLEESFKDAMDTGRQASGTGASGSFKSKAGITLSKQPKSANDVYNGLLEAGLVAGTKEFDEAYSELSEGLPVR